ncbi:MAG: hypothetical protein DRI90_10685 [Deltaproteobacteria bacterium]|nr:MAG: hypothetical protein DRI90_10685 [Deltaproteobacteria bacterium]
MFGGVSPRDTILHSEVAVSEHNIRAKLRSICETLDEHAGRSGSPGMRGALFSILLGTGLAIGACGDSVESEGGDAGSAAAAGWTGTGGGATSSAYGGPMGGWGTAYGVPGGWGGVGGLGGEGGLGGDGGNGGQGGDGGALGGGGAGGD